MPVPLRLPLLALARRGLAQPHQRLLARLPPARAPLSAYARGGFMQTRPFMRFPNVPPRASGPPQE